MTISATTLRKSFTGDGSTTAFSFDKRFLANGDLKVYQNGTLKTITTHYTVTGAGNSGGGTVTFVTAPALNDKIVIINDPSNTQSLDLVANDPFPAESLEAVLDRLTLQIQRCRDLIGRSVVLSDTDLASASTALPAPVSNNLLAWNLAATALQNVDPASLGTLTIGAGSILTGQLADGILANSTAGRLKMEDGYLSADAGGRAKMADRFTTFAKVQAVATSRLLGRTTAGSGDVEELSVDATLALAAGVLGQAAGTVVGTAYAASSATASGTTAIPNDNTVPQNTEGDPYSALDTAYTPKFASSLLLVTVTIPVIASSVGDVVGALFRDSGANAIGMTKVDLPTNNVGTGMVVRALVAAGGTSATTFKFRFGGPSGTTYIGSDGATEVYGAAKVALMTVQEIKQ